MEAEDRIIRNSCCFRNIQNKKNATVTAKIVDVLPLIRKTRAQSQTVVIFHCVDGKANSSRIFKIFFFGESAEKMWSLKLGINDYIAIRKAVPIQDHSYRHSNRFYPNILVIKSLSTCMNHVLFRKDKGEWTSLENSENTQRSSTTNTENTTEREVVSSSNGVNSPTRNEANDSDNGIISSTDWLVVTKTVESSQAPRNEPDHGTPETSNAGQLDENLGQITPSKENNPQKLRSPFKVTSKIRSPESLMQGIVRCYQHKNDDQTASSRNATSQLKCVYTKLADIRENMVVNIVGIIHEIPDTHIRTSTNKCCLIIHVTDDTNSVGFKIRIFYHSKEDRPVLQRYCLILCQEMKVTKVRNELCGTIFHSRQIVTFDRDDPKICYKHSSDFSLTPEDEERVERLRSWMFENIPIARPFTLLASIANKNDTVNLRCQIVDVKDYDKNIIVLRVSDGTTCEVPFQRVPFECDSWQSALSEMKSNREPSKEIDIIVHVRYDHIYKKLKLELKAGSTVELFNVSLKLLPDPVKTKPGNSLKAYLEGDAQNIIVTRKKKLPQTNTSDRTTNLKITAIKSKSVISQISRKRKLFEPSPTYEKNFSDDDSEKSLDIIAASPKKSKSASTIKSVGPSTSSTHSTGARDSTFKRTLLSPAKSSHVEKSIDLLPGIDSSVAVPASHSPELVQYIGSTDNSLDSISLAQTAREKAASKSLGGLLHQKLKSVEATERSAMMKRVEDCYSKNSVSNYLVQWPSDPGDETFYIQVTIMSTIPSINGSSSDFNLLALICSYCDKCDSFFPFSLGKWIVSDDDGPISLCPECKERGTFSPVSYKLMCEFLLSDDYGNIMPGIALHHHAENLFGCSASQLASCSDARLRVRNFVDSYVFAKGKEKRPLILKVIRIRSRQNEVDKYLILRVY